MKCYLFWMLVWQREQRRQISCVFVRPIFHCSKPPRSFTGPFFFFISTPFLLFVSPWNTNDFEIFERVLYFGPLSTTSHKFRSLLFFLSFSSSIQTKSSRNCIDQKLYANLVKSIYVTIEANNRSFTLFFHKTKVNFHKKQNILNLIFEIQISSYQKWYNFDLKMNKIGWWDLVDFTIRVKSSKVINLNMKLWKFFLGNWLHYLVKWIG